MLYVDVVLGISAAHGEGQFRLGRHRILLLRLHGHVMGRQSLHLDFWLQKLLRLDLLLLAIVLESLLGGLLLLEVAIVELSGVDVVGAVLLLRLLLLLLGRLERVLFVVAWLVGQFVHALRVGIGKRLQALVHLGLVDESRVS